MAKTTRICKVCGKEYEYCKTWLNQSKFRWQDVACSEKCGAEYFERIAISRGEITVTPPEAKPTEEKPAKKTGRSGKKAKAPIVFDIVQDDLANDETE